MANDRNDRKQWKEKQPTLNRSCSTRGKFRFNCFIQLSFFLSFFLPRVDLALFESKRLNERPLTLTDHRDMSDIQMSLSVETEWWRSSNERRTVLVNRGIKRGEISSKLGGSKIGNQVCIE